MHVRLRPYRESDLDDLVILDTFCFAPEFLFDRQTMTAFAEAANAITLIAEDGNGTMAGFVIAHVKGRAGRLHGYVLTLDVAEALRRQGVAQELMLEAEARVLEAGATWMELHVSVDNAAAIRFYERSGYLRYGTVEAYYGPAMDAFVYRKELRGYS